ncbi:MAG TPA: response regulator transcription factor [Cyclobacteriaceae bacterium]|nr:response regulator transcription factor [Cyclobacteriaceae bacterium]
MKILVVEDEPKVAAFVKSGLEEQNCEVDVAYDGQIGERLALSNVYNIILLDIIMPMINGLELCKRIKQSKPNTPILMLTALGTTDDKVSGFESGADDYLVKPFEFKELMVRIKALTRRSYSNNDPGNRLKIADLELDMDKKVAIRGGKTIELTAKEYSLLEYFIRNKGRVVSRLDISEKVWDINFDTGTNVVDVYVNILRKKIDRDFANKLIHTRVGMGYILTEEE